MIAEGSTLIRGELSKLSRERHHSYKIVFSRLNPTDAKNDCAKTPSVSKKYADYIRRPDGSG